MEASNDRSDSFVDHSGTVRDARTGKAVEAVLRGDGQDTDDTLGKNIQLYSRDWRMLIAGLSQLLNLGSTMLVWICSTLSARGKMLSVSRVTYVLVSGALLASFLAFVNHRGHRLCSGGLIIHENFVGLLRVGPSV